MTDFALDQTMRGTGGGPIQPASRPNLDKGFNPLTMILFFGILAAGLLFVAYSIYVDVEETRRQGHDLPALLAVDGGIADRARLRIRQRVP